MYDHNNGGNRVGKLVAIASIIVVGRCIFWCCFMVYGGAQLASYILEDITSHICVCSYITQYHTPTKQKSMG